MTPRWQWIVFAYLVIGAVCSSCAHRFARSTTAASTEEERTEWQTAAMVVENKQSVAIEKKQGSRETRRFSPDGKLVELVTEQWGSDGRVQVESAVSGSASATGEQQRKKAAKKDTDVDTSVKAGPPWWWLLAVILLVGAGTAFAWRWFRRARTLIG